MTDLQATALDYAARGWRVLPVHTPTPDGACTCGRPGCRDAGKHPRIRDWQHAATRDPDQIRVWWARWPDSSIGIATGAESGLIVIDVDGPAGEAALIEMIRRCGPLPPRTPVARTGRTGGGRHIYLAHPGGETPSCAGLAGLAGLDVRATGGYVVAPPSLHASGARYAWELAPETHPVAAVPEGWIAVLRAGSRRQRASGRAGTLEARIPEGQRHDALVSLAGSMRARGMAAEEMEAGLREISRRRCDPPLDEEEIRAIAESVAQYPPSQALRRTGAAPRRETAADVLIRLGRRLRYLVDERGDAFAILGAGAPAPGAGEDPPGGGDVAGAETDAGHQVEAGHAAAIRGAEFARWLRAAYYTEMGRGVADDALAVARGTLEARAHAGAPRRELHVRVAHVGGEVWLDLGDLEGRVAHVTAAGWEVLDRHPILHRRFPHMELLPLPERGGDLRDLLQFLPLRTDQDRMLVLCWLVAVMMDDIPRYILALHGPEGSGKTTVARMLRGLIDPSAIMTLSPPSRPEEMAQALDHHALPILDNLGWLRQWQGDLLCRAVTGDGQTSRRLYTDDDDVLRAYRRAIIMTGITIPSAAPDLLDRMLRVELDRIDPAARQDEAALWARYEAARPRLLGALLDAVAGALRIAPALNLSQLPRMADAARWMAAGAVSLGYGTQALLDALADVAARHREDVLAEEPLARVVLALVEQLGEWRGTAAELLGVARQRMVGSDGLPKTPRGVTQTLARLAVTLREAGVQITRHTGHDHTRLIVLSRVGQRVRTGPPPSPPTISEAHSGAVAGGGGYGGDAGAVRSLPPPYRLPNGTDVGAVRPLPPPIAPITAPAPGGVVTPSPAHGGDGGGCVRTFGGRAAHIHTWLRDRGSRLERGMDGSLLWVGADHPGREVEQAIRALPADDQRQLIGLLLGA